MARVLLLVLLLAVQSLIGSAKPNCPLYGPQFPTPTNILQHDAVKAAAKSLDDLFLNYLDNDNATGSQDYSYVIEVFSANEAEPLWSHYWTAPSLKTMDTTGVRKVDRDTVFRIGSITKIFSVLAFLTTVGDSSWNDPITKYLPELAAIAEKNRGNFNPIFTPDWDSITIGSLASQTSGLIRDYTLLGEVTQELDANAIAAFGFPPLPPEEIPTCGAWPTCSKQQLFEGLAKLPPSFYPFTTPAYSDIGFNLLSYVAEAVTGAKFSSLVQDHVLAPLNLTRTFITAPNDSLGIVPGNRYSTPWAFDMGEEWATGNMYSSAADLSALGRAILNSTLLKPAQTRRWLKPVSFTSDSKSMVGMPWGIRQLPLPGNQSYQLAYTFNKAGAVGKYASLLAIIPDLEIGFTVLTAGNYPAGLTMNIADALEATYLPTMMNMAREQARTTYSGVYRSSNTSLNSSLTVTVDGDKPGLGLSTWISNGTDMRIVSIILVANVAQEYWDNIQPSVRLYPTGLQELVPGGGKRVAFKAVFEDISLPKITQPFTTDCATWVAVTGAVYGSKPLDLFIFNFNAAGDVTSVENAALRATLDKIN